MPEFRQDLVTGDWVIVAQDRANRPHDGVGAGHVCPFCPENEERTPPPVMTVGGEAGWSVRIVPNKYPALTPDGVAVQGRVGPHTTLTGVGTHDVVIESPRHDSRLATYSVEHLAEIIMAWAERHNQLARDPRIQYVQVLRNHGRRGGASLEHPHSQIMAMPFVPDRVRMELSRADSYMSLHSTCIYCDLISHEVEAGARIIMADGGFVAMAPFAPKMSFETWILPMAHQPSFGQVDAASAMSLARVLSAVAKAMCRVIEDPPHNIVIRTTPTDAGLGQSQRCRDSYHWRLEIIPRLGTPAGFELGTGVFVNVIAPEDAARYLRTAVSAV